MFKYGLADFNDSNEIKTLIDSFTNLGGQRTDSPDWDLLWYFKHEPPTELYKNISDLRRINHIPGIHVLTNKWNLFTHLSRHWETGGLDNKTNPIHRYFPNSWKYPEEEEEIRRRLQRQPEKPLILKLMNTANGVAMELLQHENELPGHGQWLAQEYLDDPHLINGRKYILQVFLLITSSDPLTAYLYRDGEANLAVQPYSTDPEQRKNPGIHIATTVLQAHQADFDLAKHCLTLKQWREHVAETTNATHLWTEIETILKETLRAVAEPLRETANEQLAHPEQCFELLAVDIMLDSTLKPWLIECNRSASMQTQYSGYLKSALLKDALGLILERRQTLSDTPTGQAAPQSASEFGGFKRII